MFTSLMSFLGTLWGYLRDALGALWNLLRPYLQWTCTILGFLIVFVKDLVDWIVSLVTQLITAIGVLVGFHPTASDASGYNEILTFANTFFPLSETIAACGVLVSLWGSSLIIKFIYWVRKLILP